MQRERVPRSRCNLSLPESSVMFLKGESKQLFREGYSFGWFCIQKNSTPHHREHSPVRGEGSAEDTREYPPTLEVCDHTFDDDPVVIDVPVQVFLVVGEFSVG